MKYDPNVQKNLKWIHIPPLKLLCTQILLTERSRAEDFRFIKRSLLEENCPDFHGFNKNDARTAGQAPKPKSKITFRQLIDQAPSEPSTMLTSMVDAEKVTNAAGEKITVLTADQQNCFNSRTLKVLFLISCGLTTSFGCSLSLG